jgi:RNA polymerase sigma-70 factor (ECF subfamily)
MAIDTGNGCQIIVDGQTCFGEGCMDESDSIPALAQRLRSGDPRAAEEVFARYAQQLIQVADRHLNRKMAGRVDGEDVIQSVFRTFFRRNVQGEFQINSSPQIWRLLVKITVRKAHAMARYHTAGVRDIGAESPDGENAWLLAAASHEPGPEEAVILVDQIEVMLRGLPESYYRVLEMRLHGESVIEIAAELGVSRQTVYRALELLQQRLVAGDSDTLAGEPGNHP